MVIVGELTKKLLSLLLSNDDDTDGVSGEDVDLDKFEDEIDKLSDSYSMMISLFFFHPF